VIAAKKDPIFHPGASARVEKQRMTNSRDPVASVIISTCRPGEQVRGLVASLLEQRGVGPFEILVVDNSCSPELEREVAALASSTAGTVRYVEEPKPGLHNVRHRGAVEAASDLLIYVDDDVAPSGGWLRGISDRLQDPDIAMVGGRTLLRFESEPPAWVEGFRGLLSELDLGTRPRPMTDDETPVGCNLAIRRSLLFQVGGFNPDAFADPKLLRYRGDGEVGLARKIRELGLPIWYEPAAQLEHLVPAARVTEDYVEYRSHIGGIEQAYASYRYYRRPFPFLLYRAVRSWRLAADLERLAGRDPFAGPDTVTHHIQMLRHRSCARHHLRQLASPRLRRWTLRDTYLTAARNGAHS